MLVPIVFCLSDHGGVALKNTLKLCRKPLTVQFCYLLRSCPLEALFHNNLINSKMLQAIYCANHFCELLHSKVGPTQAFLLGSVVNWVDLFALVATCSLPYEVFYFQKFVASDKRYVHVLQLISTFLVV